MLSRSPILRIKSPARHPSIVHYQLPELDTAPEASQAFIAFLNETLSVYDRLEHQVNQCYEQVTSALLLGLSWEEVTASLLEVTIDQLGNRLNEYVRVVKCYYMDGLDVPMFNTVAVQ